MYQLSLNTNFTSMKQKNIGKQLRNGEYLYGTAILSPSTIWPEAVSAIGLDFVFIDTEHTPLDRQTVSSMCHVYRGLGLAPIVRIPSPDPYAACMVMDGGATGVIAPYIETAAQAFDLVTAVKYKPLKGKLAAERNKDNVLTADITDYLSKTNEGNVLILNIESVPAIENLDDILSVDGIDAVLVGPHDLTCSLGIPGQYDHPDFKAAVSKIIQKARAKNVGAGIHVFYSSGFNQEIEWAQQGANLIVHSSDILAFKQTLQKEIRHIKEIVDPNSIINQDSTSIII